MGFCISCEEVPDDTYVGKKPELRIIHFNDVYNIESHENKEVPGGVARFVSALRQAREEAAT